MLSAAFCTNTRTPLEGRQVPARPCLTRISSRTHGSPTAHFPAELSPFRAAPGPFHMAPTRETPTQGGNADEVDILDIETHVPVAAWWSLPVVTPRPVVHTGAVVPQSHRCGTRAVARSVDRRRRWVPTRCPGTHRRRTNHQNSCGWCADIASHTSPRTDCRRQRMDCRRLHQRTGAGGNPEVIIGLVHVARGDRGRPRVAQLPRGARHAHR